MGQGGANRRLPAPTVVTMATILSLLALVLLAPPAAGAAWERDWFGLAPPPAAVAPGPAVIVPQQAPRAPDELFTLIGFVAVMPGSGGEGLAVFLDKNSRQEGFYRAGDLVGGYRVLEITGDGVKLESPLGDTWLARQGGVQLLRGTLRTAAFRVRVDLLLERLREQAGELAGLETTPEYRDGRFAGRRLAGVEAVDLLYNLGLRDGDLVTEVNDVTVEEGAAMLDLYRSILARGEREVRLALVRNGRPHRLIYYLE